MCLAVVGKVIEIEENCATVDILGNLVKINIQLTPEAIAGTLVLIHAGFALSIVSQEEGLEIERLLHKIDLVLYHV